MQAELIGGRYELVEQVGSGGMGQVWRGYDTVLDREIAVKLIRTDVVASDEQAEEFAKRFQREARVTARIRHHGVPQVYDAVLGESYERVYLIMEFVSGTPLTSFITPGHPLPVAWAAAVAAQLAAVLSHAHAVPVVHRDIKPENVLVTPAGDVKLLDFGIAALLGTGVTRLTSTGSPLGTSRYMSPEQVRAVQVTPRSDLYALGCVLHELLCGQYVFDAGNDFELMQQHVYAAPRPLRELRADVPAALEQLVRQMLAKSPEDRPADAYEVYERLLPFLPLPGAEVPAAERGPTGVPDPTLMYRRPNAPRPRPESRPADAVAPDASAPSQPGATLAAGVRETIREADVQFDRLMDDGRYVQAAEELQKAIAPAAVAYGADNRRVLRLRGLPAGTPRVRRPGSGLRPDRRRHQPGSAGLPAAGRRLSRPAWAVHCGAAAVPAGTGERADHRGGRQRDRARSAP